eukprot:6901808-Prymnesium_polylepis.1
MRESTATCTTHAPAAHAPRRPGRTPLSQTRRKQKGTCPFVVSRTPTFQEFTAVAVTARCRGQAVRSIGVRGFESTGAFDAQAAAIMVLLIVIPSTDKTTHDEKVADRGRHDLTLEDAEADLPQKLAEAQPEYPWKQGTPFVSWYGDFADVVLSFADIDGEVHAALKVSIYILHAAGLGRLWALVLSVMRAQDWRPCSKGVFRKRLRAAKLRSTTPSEFMVRRKTGRKMEDGRRKIRGDMIQ